MMYAVLFGIALAVGIEVITCIGRFALKLRSREIQRRLLGIRLHHGYAASFAIPAVLFVPPVFRAWVLAIAGALILSDLVHHFVVLPLATGQMD